jgi:hypothetical protein
MWDWIYREITSKSPCDSDVDLSNDAWEPNTSHHQMTHLHQGKHFVLTVVHLLAPCSSVKQGMPLPLGPGFQPNRPQGLLPGWKNTHSRSGSFTSLNTLSPNPTDFEDSPMRTPTPSGRKAVVLIELFFFFFFFWSQIIILNMCGLVSEIHMSRRLLALSNQ